MRALRLPATAVRGSCPASCDRFPAMPELGPVAWPPAPIRTERLVLREPEARDRAAFIELQASPEVSSYLGGPRPRDELEREMPGAPERYPGLFAVDLDGAMIGQVILRRAHGGSVPAAAGKAELGYLFLPRAWGFGYALEACAAALGWLAGELPGEPVVISIHSRATLEQVKSQLKVISLIDAFQRQQDAPRQAH